MLMKNLTQTTEIATLLKSGAVAILPTDTIYGLHCLADRADLISKIQNLKQRDGGLFPVITLISKISDLEKFHVSLNSYELGVVSEFWPGANTLIFQTDAGEARSFRLPKNQFLTTVIHEVGPLVSTSANLHGQPAATDIAMAQRYFGDAVDLYVDGGVLSSPPSSIYRVLKGSVEKIR
jgi:L-threonylcarbamoyladenylate synthase